ncbi:diaminopimelate decarboxylase [Thermoplasma volcanium GSS1]|uniref:Diaminopimelate decarboxylase n=1 Tax=Thermoplasma volcanium (strain ATCC 51530 / DSM 4299 / JCM 9571 / NBRC 15438 / GSS1) TaxID=273116 RepID=Q97AJ0_THEVO|nr:diaminopimelate decarboxylase [Thermoplasma volcanium]BAB59962.1 diaminopimelate decarboxylase [Thermoplasma volcanium GSS1]
MENDNPFVWNGDDMLVEGYSVKAIVETFGTPVIIYSAPRIVKNVSSLFGAMPKVTKCFYSVKANSNPNLVRLIGRQGCGSEVTSLGEIQIAMISSIDPDDILFTPNNVSKEEMDFALDRGIKITFNSPGQFELVSNRVEEATFRINPGIGHGEHPGTTTGGHGSKFGIDPETALKLYTRAKELGIRKFGIHMMVGSNNTDADLMLTFYKKFFDMASEIEKTAHLQFSYIDIGGGFGVPYNDEQRSLDIKKLGSGLKELVDQYGIERLFIEPGRYIVADAGILVGKVYDVYNGFVGTDIGMNINIRHALYGAEHRFYALTGRSDEAEYIVTGQICENTDVTGRLTGKVQIGDLVAMYDAGAYIYSMSSNYNGRFRPTEVIVDHDGVYRIRRRETVNDILATVTGMEKVNV